MMFFRTIILIFLLVFISPKLFAQEEVEEETEINIDSLRDLVSNKRNDFEKMKLYISIAKTVLDYDIDYARECSEKTIDLAKKLNDSYYEASGFLILSTSYSYEDLVDSALTAAYNGLEVVDNLVRSIDSKINNQKKSDKDSHQSELDSARILQSKFYNSIGSLLANFGQFSEAIDYYHKALEYGDSLAKYEIYNNLGLISAQNQVYDIAIEQFNKSKQLATECLDSSGVIECNVLLATTYLDMYQTGKDVTNLLLALAMSDGVYEQFDPSNLYVMMNVAVVFPQIYIEAYRYFRDSEDTLITEYLDKAREINDAGFLRGLEFINDNLISNKVIILTECGDLKSAKKNLDKLYGTNVYYECAPYYLKAVGDYQSLLEVLSEKNTKERQLFSVEYTIKSEKLFAQTAYEEKIHGIDTEIKRRNMEFEEQTSRHSLMLKWMLITFAIGLAVICYIIVMRTRTTRDNKLLELQNRTINSRNAELIQLGEEVMAQTDEISSQRNIIEKQRDVLNDANEHLLASIKYASRIQKAAVPSVETLQEMFSDIFVYWQPLEIVSGDFYWAMERNGIKYLIVADCTGHGVPGALVSILGISLLNDIAAGLQTIKDPAEFLNQFKDKFLDCIKDIQDGMDLALVFIDEKNHEVKFSGARRPLFLVRGGEIIEFKPDKICIGMNYMREQVKFTSVTIDTLPGDMFYAFSDGLTDQFGGENYTKFTMSRLKDIFKTISTEPVEDQQHYIQSEMSQWMHGFKEAAQIDDQLIIGFRVE